MSNKEWLEYQVRSGYDLGGVDRSHYDLTGVNARRARLNRAYLAFSNFTEADLCQASFHFSCLADANLSRADLMATDFTLTDLTGANFSGADLTRATFSERNTTPTLDNVVWISETDWDRDPVGALRDLRERSQGATINDEPFFKSLAVLATAGKTPDPRAFFTGQRVALVNEAEVDTLDLVGSFIRTPAV